jgi:fido (protein-threonine AMPylation protein)
MVYDLLLKRLLFLLGLVFVSVSGAYSTPLSDHIKTVLDQNESRQQRALKKLLRDPFPSKGAQGGAGLWHYENFALAANGLNQRTAEANAGILTLHRDLFEDANSHHEAGAMHWHAYLQQRIYWLYSSSSKHFPSRMSLEAENAILQMLWDFAAPICDIAFTDLDKIWWHWGSENHHLMAWVSFWGAAHIFKDHPDYKDRRYQDGSKPAEMAAAFDAYFKHYARERASKGLFIEVAAPTYAKYSLNTLYNIYDFADDPVLKKRIDMLLNLNWADWAIEQINGVRGGSRHRSYAGRSSNAQSGAESAAWYYFGFGKEASVHPGVMCAATTFWRPSSVVMALALDAENREPFFYISRRPGLSAGQKPMNFVRDRRHPLYDEKGMRRVEPAGGSLLRTTWVTPDFVMGMSQVDALPMDAWWAASSQNRWNGIIFAGHPTARIFTQRPKLSGRKSLYNEEWGVQYRGVMILHRLRESNAHGQMIWFDNSLKKVERDDWHFVEAPQAFAALRIARGGAQWEEDTLAQRRDGKGADGLGQWLVLQKQFSPIIIEVVCKSDYASFEDFQSAILRNHFAYTSSELTYQSEFYKAKLSLPLRYNRQPEINGIPVNMSPDYVYRCPYIKGDFGDGVIRIQYRGVSQTVDFNDNVSVITSRL